MKVGTSSCPNGTWGGFFMSALVWQLEYVIMDKRLVNEKIDEGVLD